MVVAMASGAMPSPDKRLTGKKADTTQTDFSRIKGLQADDAATDTTGMDSLQLAVYHHNKAVDDSLRLDSINRKKKNGIDAPVTYQADDSLVYMASSNTAHLYGSAEVKYENMDLKSDKIKLSLDSSLVHAT